MAALERKQIKARIAEARKEAGLTQPELGELMSPPVHYRTVQDWESLNVDTVPFRYVNDIARVTARSPEWLLHGEEMATPEFSRLVERLEAAVAALVAELALQRDLRGDHPARAAGEPD